GVREVPEGVDARPGLPDGGDARPPARRDRLDAGGAQRSRPRGLRVPDAVRRATERPTRSGRRRPPGARLRAVRHRVVPLLHAPPGRTPGEPRPRRPRRGHPLTSGRRLPTWPSMARAARAVVTCGGLATPAGAQGSALVSLVSSAWRSASAWSGVLLPSSAA